MPRIFPENSTLAKQIISVLNGNAALATYLGGTVTASQEASGGDCIRLTVHADGAASQQRLIELKLL